jgi:hypothetical protein
LNNKRPVRFAASGSRTGPASPRRSVCAPDQMSPHSTADHVKEQTINPLRSLLSASVKRPGAGARSLIVRQRSRLKLEALEDRTVPTAVAPPSGLVSWWTADNTASDLMTRNNATLTNGVACDTGEVQQAFSFDGVDNRAVVGDPDSLKLTASLSIEG